MELVKVWGWWLVLICGVLLVRPPVCERALAFGEKEEGALTYGLIWVLVGVPTLVLNGGRLTELTVIGALFTAGGVLGLGAPKLIARASSFLRKNLPVALALLALGFTYGLWLLFHY